MNRIKYCTAVFAALLTFAVMLSAVPALAEWEGDITFGRERTNQDPNSFKSGEYTGKGEERSELIGDVHLTSHGDGNYYVEFIAKDLALPTTSVYLELGRPGDYKFYVGYNELPKLISDNARSIFYGSWEKNVLTLPVGFTPGVNTTAISAGLSTLSQPVKLEMVRKTIETGFVSKGNNNSSGFNVSLKREYKDGVKSIGGTVGASVPNSRGTVLPEPVDYITDELRVSAEGNGEKAQLKLEYYFSNFRNDNEYLKWNSAFQGIPAAGFNLPVWAAISLPPDNQHHRLSLSGGYNLTNSTRLSFIGEYGIMKQDETLMPYSINHAPLVAMPRTSAETQIDTLNLGLYLSTRLTNRLSLSLSGKYYKTDNKTPKDLWLRVVNDSNNTSTRTPAAVMPGPLDPDPLTTFVSTSNSQFAVWELGGGRYNLPYDNERTQGNFDLSYYFGKGTNLTAGYGYDKVERSYRESLGTKETTVKTRLSSRIADSVNYSVYVSRSDRTSIGSYEETRLGDELNTHEALLNCARNTYALNAAYFTANPSLNPMSFCFDNHPLLRKFDIAERIQYKFGWNAMFYPNDTVTIGLYYNGMDNNYHNSTLGLTDEDSKDLTLDLTITPSSDLSVYAYYTKENIGSAQTSIQYSGTGATAPLAKILGAYNWNRRWWLDVNEDVDTLGVGVKKSLIEDKLVVKADYSRMYSVTAYDVGAAWPATGVANNVAPYSNNAQGALPVYKSFPLLKTKRDTFNVGGEYAYSKTVDVGLTYGYERFKTSNWSTDNTNPSTAITGLLNVITLYGTTPAYHVHTAGMYMKLKI